MNKLTATITAINQSGAILLVDAEVEGHVFSVLLIETTARPVWLEKGKRVGLVFKETEVTLAKDFTGKISTRNRMQCRVVEIEKGELLSKVTMQYNNCQVVSVITSRALNALGIIENDEVTAMVKANEVSLMMLQEL